MDIPAKVYITCPSAELKKQPGPPIPVPPHGYSEVHVRFGSNPHALPPPTPEPALLNAEPVLPPRAGFELKRAGGPPPPPPPPGPPPPREGGGRRIR